MCLLVPGKPDIAYTGIGQQAHHAIEHPYACPQYGYDCGALIGEHWHIRFGHRGLDMYAPHFGRAHGLIGEKGGYLLCGGAKCRCGGVLITHHRDAVLYKRMIGYVYHYTSFPSLTVYLLPSRVTLKVSLRTRYPAARSSTV